MSESTELKDAVQQLTSTIEKLRDELVRKDVYAVDQRLMGAQIDAVDTAQKELRVRFDKAEERADANRRLFLASLALPIVLIIIQLYLAAQTGGAG